MKLHQLKPKEGSVQKRKRLGRGEASGKGGTSTKGNKGQQSRSGYSAKWGHEGGQMPIQRRLPKRGFNNINTIKYKVFNLGNLDQLIESYDLKEFTLESLYLNKLINRTDKVKILAKGEAKNVKLPIKVNAISEKAKQALESLGCKVELIQIVAPEKKENSKNKNS